MTATPAESRSPAEWPFADIALPVWLRIEEFRYRGNVLGVASGVASAQRFQEMPLDVLGALFRFALTCHPSVPWEQTVRRVCAGEPWLEDRLRDGLLERARQRAQQVFP